MSVFVLCLLRGSLVPVLFAVPGGPGPNSSVNLLQNESEQRDRSEDCRSQQRPDEPSFAPFRAKPKRGATIGRKLSETVDLIELNHFYDDLGRHSYDQVIFYEWSPDYSRYHVIAWSLVEQDKSRVPRKDAHRKDYYVEWYDRDARVYREVRSKVCRETWSQIDPERANKKLMDEKYRLSLLQK